MGFGAGFGEGFTNAFNQQRQRSHERETDEFRYRMETLIKKKDKIDEYKREDAKNAGLAKAIVENSGAPPEAVNTAYSMLRDGATYDDVAKVFATRKFSVKPKSEADQQMQDSGMGTPPAPEDTTQPAPAAPVPDGGGLLTRMFPGMKKFAPAAGGNRTDERVTKTTGMTPEEIAEVDAGYTPPELDTSGVTSQPIQDATNDPIEAKRLMDEAQYALQQDPQNPELKTAADAARRQYTSLLKGTLAKSQVSEQAVASGQSIGSMEVVATTPEGHKKVVLANQVMDDNGDVVYQDPETGEVLNKARPIGGTEKDTAERIVKNIAEPMQKYDADAQNLAGAYAAYGTARQLIADNPEIINDRAADADKYLVDLGKDVVAGMNIVNQILAAPESAAGADPTELQTLEEKLKHAGDSMNLGPAQKIAQARGILKVQYALGAYYLASGVGQSDKNVAEKERIMLTELPGNATTLPAWDQMMGSILAPRKQMLDQISKRLPEMDPEYKGFKDRYKYSPVGEINNMETYLKDVPAAADLDRILPHSGFGVVKTPEESKTPDAPEKTAPAEYPGYTYTGKTTPQGVPLYKDKDGNIGTME